MSAKTMRAAQIGALWRIASTRMPTKWGMFEAIGYERDVSNGTRRVETALAIVMGDPTEGVPLLRIHSQCFTGEVLGSLRCDCHDQLEMAMQAIAEEGRGLVIYEYQEGRGIGLMANMPALTAILDEIFCSKPMAHWYEVFNGVHVTFGVVQGPQEVINDPQLRVNEIVVPLEGAGGKLTSTISSPIQVHGVAKAPARRAPALGEHNEEILKQLGFSATEIDGLRASGATPKAKERAA